MSMMMTKTTRTEVRQAILNGNRVQLIGRGCGSSKTVGVVTAYEHVGQSYAQPGDDAFEIGWLDGADDIELALHRLHDTDMDVLSLKLSNGLSLAEIVY